MMQYDAEACAAIVENKLTPMISDLHLAYDLDKVAQNHERFATSHEIAASSEVKSLAASARKARSKER